MALIPWRKLQVGLDNSETLVKHATQQAAEMVTQEFNWNITGQLPELRFTETDQTDPTGRFRFRATAGTFVLEQALTANWATDVGRLHIGVDASTVQLLAYSATGKVTLGGGDAFGAAGITCHGNSHATYPGGILFETIGASVSKTRLTFDSGADTGNITVSNAKFNAPNIYCTTLWGQGTGQMSFRPGLAVTDATEYPIVLYVLNATADTWLDMITLTPNGASPTMSFNSRAITSVGALTFTDGSNLAVGTSSGSQIGTAVGQKIAFYGVAPTAQQTHIADPTGGGTVDAEARTAINSILVRLETIGITATS